MAIEIELKRRRFTVEEYHRMAEAGILHEDDRVELIEGEIVELAPIGRRHAACVAALTHVLVSALGERAVLWPQNPIRLPRDTEPQPDVVLLRPPLARYAQREAGAEDVLLLVEVGDSSLRYDRLVKLPLYGRAGIPEVWIVDVDGEAIDVHREPTPRGYERAERVGRDGRVSPEAFPDVRLAVSTVLVLSAR